jgi:hypothetical protein
MASLKIWRINFKKIFKQFIMCSKKYVALAPRSLDYCDAPASGGIICRWILLFQEYDFKIMVKAGRMNKGLDHL